MVRQEVQEFIAAVIEAKETEIALHKEFQLELVEDKHPLGEVFNSKQCLLPIILVSKYVEPRPNQSSVDHDDSRESYEGSPMKLQEFSISDKACNGITSHSSGSREIHPLPVNTARYLLSLLNLGCRDNPELPPVWVTCGGDSASHIMFMGAVIAHKEGQVIMESFKVTSEGPFLGKTKLPTLIKLVQKDIGRNSPKLSMTCFAQYDILSHVTDDHPLLGHRGSLEIKLEWNKATSLLQTAPLDARAVVNATVVAGDVSSAAYGMYTELATLQGLAAGLKDGQITWAVREEGEEEAPLSNRVRQLIEASKLGDTIQRQSEEEGPEEEEAFTIHKLGIAERADLDFTEHLWNVLKDCDSYRELTDCLQLVFACLQKGELQPMVHKGNKCMLAELTRDWCLGRSTAVSLTGLVPLQILVEIGLEKLRRDYTNVMIGKDLVAESHIGSFVRREGSVEDGIARLEKLHHSLELVVMLSQFLNLPKVVLGITAIHALRHYEKNAVDKNHIFSVPVQTSNIITIVEKTQPSVWKADLVSKVETKEAHTVYYLSSKPPFGQIPKTDTPVSDESLITRQDLYYLTTASQKVLFM